MTAFRIVDGDNIKVKTVLNEMENLPEIGYKILNKTQVRYLDKYIIGKFMDPHEQFNFYNLFCS